MTPAGPVVAEEPVEIGGLQLHAGDRIGPYVYRRPIGKGGMAHVLLGVDPDGLPVALKVLKSNRIHTGLARFKREFRALARLRHPNVIRVDAYGDLHGHPYIAMEYVAGTDLHATIHGFRTSTREERWRRVEDILIDLARALAYIHRRGLVHRDLKPSNVLIDGDGRCKLTDFGIVKDLDPNLDTAVSTTLVGTWAYASPEQISGGAIDHRSDLYSLGVILFAMLTGRRPFVAKDLNGYLELHRSHRAPTARSYDPHVPPHLDDICQRLLRKSPRDRFRSAQEVLYRLEQLDAEPDADRAGAYVPLLVGRTVEEAAIAECVARLTTGRGGVLLLEGEEGAGKTRLLDVVGQHAHAVGLSVITERVRPREVPGAPLVRIARRCAHELGQAVPESLLPAIAAFADEIRPAAGNARERLVEALGDAFEVLLDSGPVLLAVDDLHEAQAPTMDGLGALVHRLLVAESRPLLIAGTWRSDRAGPRLLAFVDGSSGLVPECLRAAPLTPDDLQSLVEHLLGAGRPAIALAERLHRETDGNPLFVALFLQHLMVQGFLVRSGTAWRVASDVDEIASGHLEIPPGIRQVVRARLAPLDPDERELVEALAAYGREMDLDLLLDVLDIDEDVVGDLVESLEERGIVRQRRMGEQVTLDFNHSKFADVLYRELHVERRAELHRRIAAVLEVRHAPGSAAAEVIGEHFRRAGEAGKSWQFLVAAARRMFDRGLGAEAWDLTVRAQSVEDAARVDLDVPAWMVVRHNFLMLRGDLHQLRGEWADARDAFEQAVGLGAEGDEAGTRSARLKLARALRSLGEIEAAEREAATALQNAREALDRTHIAEGLLVLAGIAWARGDLDACERNAQEGLVGAVGAAFSGQRANLLVALATAQASRGMLASAAGGIAEAQLLYKDLGLRPARAIALANLAEVLLLQGDVGGAWQAATDALAEAAAAGHRVGDVTARNVRAGIALAVGAYSDARPEVASALAGARAQKGGVLGPLCHAARLALLDGDLKAVLKLTEEAEAGGKSGDPEGLRHTARVLRAIAFARQGADAPARSGIEAVTSHVAALPVFRRVAVLLDLGEANVAIGETGRAVEHFRLVTQLGSMRGFRLATLDAMVGLARCAPDPTTRARARSDLDVWLPEVLSNVPARWADSLTARCAVDG